MNNKAFMPKDKQDKGNEQKRPYDRFEELARQVFSIPLSKIKPERQDDDNNKQSKRKRRKR